MYAEYMCVYSMYRIYMYVECVRVCVFHMCVESPWFCLSCLWVAGRLCNEKTVTISSHLYRYCPGPATATSSLASLLLSTVHSLPGARGSC